MRPQRVKPSTSAPRLTSLLLVEEKLAEAKHFIGCMMRVRDPHVFAFELNAFLSAVRSALFLLRKEMARVPGFRAWWSEVEVRIEADPVLCFFRDLRNYSQKEGRVRLVGWGRWVPSLGKSRWNQVFASGLIEVPPSLQGMDVVDASRLQLAMTARIVCDFASAFPHHSCPARALTVEGVRKLSINLDEVDRALGFPPGFTSVDARFDDTDRVRMLAQHVDAVDFDAIEALTRFVPRRLRLQKELDARDPLGVRIAAKFAGL